MREFDPAQTEASGLLHFLGKWWMRLFGWKPVGRPPTEKKYVLLGVPHTSNWDLLVMLAVSFYFHIPVYWMGKTTIFRWPVRRLMLWLGGIPIDRSKSHNVVDQAIDAFNKADALVIAILPEGTRKRTEHWKSGFYNIALGAGVPIALGFVDYKRRLGGFGPTLYPSGDIDADMVKLREFYKDITGLHAECQGPIQLRPGETARRPAPEKESAPV